MRFGSEHVEGMTLGQWWAIAEEVDVRLDDRMALDWDQEVARARLMLEPPRRSRRPRHPAPLPVHS